jgi:predicted DNA-binding antitoxin AbrB/MazE fold protein
MTYQIDAIYDGGVLKPLEPLALSDQTHVKLIVELQNETSESLVLAAQKAALRKAFAEIDAMPQIPNNDGWSVRDHDQLLYGEP